MLTEDYTRREFLRQSGLLAGGVAAVCQLPTRAWAAKGSTPLRGLMVDAARVPESLVYYRRVIDFCAEWRLNALQFRVADDQGCALRFSSAPDLLFHRHAFAPEELHDLAQYGRSRGVDLIPELESFGHTGYITRSRTYAHLLDADSQQSSEFTGMIPVHPETLQLFSKLYRELSEVFPSIYLHGGCDEVNWGGSERSRKALETKQRYEIWAEYLNSLEHFAGGLGKQFVVWGDMVAHKEPRILERLNKGIVVMDWNYTETSAARLQSTLSKIRSAGCRAIGAPALISYRVGPRAGRDQLANIDAFADAYLGSKEGAKDADSLGVILTNWVPSRYIQGSIWDGFAYAAVAFNEGTSAARKSAFQRFVERHYGTSWSDDWDEAFRLFYQAAPQVHEQGTRAGAVPLRVPWSNDEQLSAVLRTASSVSNPFTPIRNVLENLGGKVSKNVADFDAFLLTVRYLEHTSWRDWIVGSQPIAREKAAALIKEIAEGDRAFAEELSKDWGRGRFADSEAKLHPLFGFEPKDQLLFQFQRAADYSGSLASRPERFVQLVRAS